VTALQSALSSDGSGLTIQAASGSRVEFAHASQEFEILCHRPNSIHTVLGVHTTAASVPSISQRYTPSGRIDITGGSRYIRIRSGLAIQEHVADVCDPGLGIYMTDTTRTSPLSTYPTRFYDRPFQINSIGIRLENPDGSLYDTGGIDHVLVVRVWKTRATSSSQQISEYQSK
jgi:hypothetical protein